MASGVVDNNAVAPMEHADMAAVGGMHADWSVMGSDRACAMTEVLSGTGAECMMYVCGIMNAGRVDGWVSP